MPIQILGECWVSRTLGSGGRKNRFQNRGRGILDILNWGVGKRFPLNWDSFTPTILYK